MSPERTRSLRRLEWFMESIPEPLVVVDDAGRIALVNASSAELFGYTPEELVGLSVEALVPESMRAAHARSRHGYTDTPRDRPMGRGVEIVGRRRDGSVFPADIELRPRTVEGHPVVIAVVRDLSNARAEAERSAGTEHARDLERLARLSRLTAEDVSELLAIILGDVGRILEEEGAQSLRPALTEIREAAAIGADLVERLLGYVTEAEQRHRETRSAEP